MSGQKPFWSKIADAINEIHYRSFTSKDGKSYALTGYWSRASRGHIKKLSFLFSSVA
ncbi:MAG: hypothetical protein NTZ65_02480 [Candidatus Berkelbacteria bacterium]|nr:hypothetical protein [Candidatus Berkelbacteria bacterium]